MERKHTKGPWGFRRHLKTTHVCRDCSAMCDPWYLHGNKNNSDFLADLFLKDDGNQVENMQLISAAPDLLAACEAGLQELQTLAHSFGLENFDSNPAVKQLRSAIAKATGGAQ